MIYNVVLISAVWQSGSVINICVCVYTYIRAFFLMFLSFMVYHRVLNTLPSALPQDLVVYPSSV